MSKSLVVVSLALLATVLLAGVASAEARTRNVKARFLGPGTWATVEGCEKLKALAAGGPRNITTVPETLTVDGFDGWEHSCAFDRIDERRKGRTWVVRITCEEGPNTNSETERFEMRADGSFDVTVGKETTRFVRCDAPPAAKGKR